MNKKFIGVLIFLSVIAISFIAIVGAVKPSQSSTGDTGIDIRSPPIDFIKVGRDVIAHTHAFNKSDGLPLDSSTTSCYIHVYNQTGSDIIEATMVFEGDDPFDWKYDIGGGNFSSVGEYSFLISCNTSAIGGGGIGGFVSGGLHVTETGLEFTTEKAIIYIGLLLVMFFVFMMNIWFINQLPSRNQQDEEGRIMSITYLKYLRSPLWFIEWMLFVAILFISSNIAFAYLEVGLLANILFVLFQITFGITPVIVIVWIVWIFAQLFHDRQFQAMLNKGIFPQGRLF